MSSATSTSLPASGPANGDSPQIPRLPPDRILWLTGLSGAGKSTLAIGLEQALAKLGRKCIILDGDNIRRGLCSDLGFSPKDRKENIRRIGEVARLFSGAGIICVTAFISPYRSDRELVRRLVDPGIFVEIYVNAPLSVCERRDPKGLYARARAGEIRDFTGISAPYEPPLHPEVEIQSDRMSPEECVNAVLRYLRL
jgi:adenylyl-sulfate kinase